MTSTMTRRSRSRRPLPDNALGLHLDWLAYGPPVTLVESLRGFGTYPDRALYELDVHVVQLAHLVSDLGPQAAAEAYLDVDLPTRRDRVAAAVAACWVEHVPVADREGHPPAGRTCRRLSPIEHGTVRLCTLDWPLRAATVALAEQGAVPGQLIDIDPTRDVHSPTDGGICIDLPAVRGRVARRVSIASWASDAAAAAARHAAKDGHSLCLTSAGTDRVRARKNVTATLDRALAVAGTDATPAGLGITLASQVADTHGMLRAVDVLGTTTLASATTLLGRAA